MSKPFLKFILLLCILLVACRQEEALPTAVPTAVVPDTLPPTSQSPPTAVPDDTSSLEPTSPPLTAAPVDPAEIDWPPQLIYSSPAPGEETRLDGAITIRFDQPMDQASVEENFTVTALTDEQTAAGSFTWPRADTVVFTPRDQLRRQQNYRVLIDQTATALNGQTLREPVNLELQTVGFLEASQLIPADNGQNIQTDTAVTILFNRPVVPLVSTGQQSSLPQPLTLEPAVAGQGEWVSTSIYRFVPDEPLAGATTYTAHIDAGLEDVTGGILENDVTWQFTTLSPEVVTIEPAAGTTSVVPTTPLIITFNMPMDPASTEAATSLRGGSTGTIDYTWSDDNRTLTVTPRQPLDLQTDYRLLVGASAQAASGQATLGQETVSSFSTVPFPAVLGTTPANGTTAERWQRGFSVRFASPMDITTLEDQIFIEPEPTGNVDYFFSEFSFELSVGFALERNVDYTITIPSTAADPYGNTLGRNYTWQFTAPGFDTVASFNLPPQVSQLSTQFPTEVDIIHVNAAQVDVALYDVGLPLNLINNPYELTEYRPAAEPLRTWSLPLETPQNEAGLLPLPLAEGDTLPTGVYFLTLTTPNPDDNARFWQNRRHLLVVADTNLVVKEMIDEIHVWVTDLGTGEPAAGRDLTLYTVRGATLGTAVSDSSGFARFDNAPVDYLEGVVVVSNRPGEAGFGLANSQWHGGVQPWQLGIDARTNPEDPLFAYIYTDRPIYRPGDTVHYKGIVRDANYGRYRLPTELQTVQLNLSSLNFFLEDRLDETFTASVDEDGTFYGEYTIPEEAELGSYQLFLSTPGANAQRQFTVAQYRAPEFLVAVTPTQDETLRGESVEVTVEASFFFGGPATDLAVNWSAYVETYRLEVPGPYYEFGDGGSYFYKGFGPFGGGGFGQFGEYLIGGSGRTDENGRLTITLPADLLADQDSGSHTVTVEATITDLTNFPVTSRASVTFHAAQTYVGIIPTDYIANVQTPASVNLLTTDWDGQPVANQPVAVIFYQRDWQRNRNADYGIYYTEWEPIDTEVARTQVTTDGQGEATTSFIPESGGSYVVVATVTDDNGRTHQSSTNLWVIDPAYGGWRTDPKERKMDLVADKQIYEVGDTAHILVQSPFEGPVKAWLTIERGQLMEQQVITLQSSSDVLDIPITVDFAPNVFVSVVAVKPVDSSENPYADIRLGIVELVVSPAPFELTVALTPRGQSFIPGDTATYDIVVTDHAGEPVQADLSLALVDLAVLTLKQDNAPPIAEAFYTRQPYRSQVGAGLLISGEGIDPEVPIEALGLGGGGGGGEGEEVLSRAAGADEEEEDIRRDFPDTAYWAAKISTGQNGRATVDIPLPDNLTTWRLSSKAVTADTRVGQSSVDIIATLPLLVRPITPRFMVVGDELELGAIVHNNTNQSLEAVVSLEADGLTFTSSLEQMITIPAHGQQRVRWSGLVEDGSFADLTFRVTSGDLRDATKPTFGEGPDNLIPVYRFDAEDLTGTSGVLTEPGRRVEAILLPDQINTRQGSVDVQLSPSLAAALLDALDYQNELDYLPVCAHAIANRLLPNAATARAIQTLALDEPALSFRLTEQIQAEIDQLEALAQPTGGWSWCYSQERDPYLTASILFALLTAEEATYIVDAEVMQAATNYLDSALRPPTDLTEAYEVNRQAFYLFVLANSGQDVGAAVDALVTERRTLLDPYAQAMLALAYEQVGEPGDNQQSLLADLNDGAIVSATGAHWENTTQDFRSLTSDVRGTAVVIDALSQLQPQNGLTTQAVRWLMSARTVAHWTTPYETAWSILALTDWMIATGELTASYGYGFHVNGQSRLDGTFSQENLLETVHTSIPINELLLDDVNFLEFRRGAGDGRLYYTAHLNSFISAETVDAVSRGITVQRTYYDAACDPEEENCDPIDQIEAGQQVRVELTIIAPTNLLHAIIEDPLPAGTEAIDPGLETSATNTEGTITPVGDAYRLGYWGWWFFDRIEYRDEKVQFLSSFLPAGTYQYTYFLQAVIPGQYQTMPATARQEFFPEVFGRSDGMLFTIVE